MRAMPRSLWSSGRTAGYVRLKLLGVKPRSAGSSKVTSPPLTYSMISRLTSTPSVALLFDNFFAALW